LLLLAFFYGLLKYLLLPKITSVEFRDFTESIGCWGYLVVMGYIVLSHVFAPVAGSPGVVLGVTIYGIKTGMWLLYFASLISAVINFGIARRFGRGWVEKLVGKRSMRKVDEFVAHEGREVLILSRLLGFALFDFVSYAAGLTKVAFWDYFMITAGASLAVNLVAQYVFRAVDFQSEMGVMIWVGSVFVAGLMFGLIISRYLGRKSAMRADGVVE